MIRLSEQTKQGMRRTYSEINKSGAISASDLLGRLVAVG